VLLAKISWQKWTVAAWYLTVYNIKRHGTYLTVSNIKLHNNQGFRSSDGRIHRSLTTAVDLYWHTYAHRSISPLQPGFEKFSFSGLAHRGKIMPIQ
jgi:hypothetical protein